MNDSRLIVGNEMGLEGKEGKEVGTWLRNGKGMDN